MTRWTHEQIVNHDFPDPRWIVPGLIPAGFCWLAGRPKIGKSVFLLQLAVAVGGGGMFLGRRTATGKVLYIFLEDSGLRVQNRLVAHRACEGVNVEYEDDLRVVGDLREGGVEYIRREVVKNGFDLVILDTFGSAAPGIDPVKDSLYMGNIVSGLLQIVRNSGASILVNDHHRKDMKDDPVSDIMGTTLKSASPDVIMGLYRDKQTAKLVVVGRDVGMEEVNIRFNPQKVCWEEIQSGKTLTRDSNRMVIIKAAVKLAEEGVVLPTTKNLAKECGLYESQVNTLLGELVSLGEFKRGPKHGREQPYYRVNGSKLSE